MSAERLTAALADRYALEHELGAGGMATVYLARDLRHDRLVALKVLRPELAAAIGAERFLAEIRTTANLQHPHILPLFDSGSVDHFLFYVMPYVRGESLRERLEREKQLPVADAVRIAREVASALDYAHRHGVIHRDIKPENILLHDGTALVADFGIALAASRAGGARMTETGMSLGTPHYMSPEQAMGEREITARSDVYALGAITYEMLLGEPPFTGPTAQAIVAKVMTEPPPRIVTRRERVPQHVEDAVLTALEKLPADRFAGAAEFAAALTADAPSRRAAEPASRPFSSVRRPAAAAAALAIAGAAALGWLLGVRSAAPERVPVTYLAASLATASVTLAELTDRFDVSADGRHIVLVSTDSAGQGRLYLRRPGALDPELLPTASGASSPVFSPDGGSIAYAQGAGSIMKLAVGDGTPVEVSRGLTTSVYNLTWSGDDRLRLPTQTNKGLLSIPVAGGAPDSVMFGPDTTVYRGEALRDGRLLMSLVVGDSAFRVAVRDTDGATREVLRGFAGRLAPSGHLLYSRREGDGWALIAAPFDERDATVAGEPITLARGIPTAYATPAAANAAGDLVYLRGAPRSDRRFVVIGRDGAQREIASDPLPWQPSFTLSPDGRTIAAALWSGGGRRVWTVSTEDGAKTPVTSGHDAFFPVWSADAREIAFTHFPLGDDRAASMWRVPADGGAAPIPFATFPDAYPRAYSPDGRRMLFMNWTSGFGDLWTLPLGSDSGEPRLLLGTPANEDFPRLSPDGRWLAFSTDASGGQEVRVAPLANPAASVQVSRGGGVPISWSRDGRLFYVGGGDVWELRYGAGGPIRESVRRVFGLPHDAVGAPVVVRDGEAAIVLRGGRMYSDLVVVERALRR